MWRGDLLQHDPVVMRICVYKYLEHLGLLNDDIREIESRIRSIRSSIELKAVNLTGLPGGSSDGDTLGAAIASLEEIESDYLRAIEELKGDYEKTFKFCLPSCPERYALWLHKVEGKTWEYIGRVIGFSTSQTKRMGYSAIPELYSFMPDKYTRIAIPDAIPKDDTL